MSLSIIIPVWNEAGKIADDIREVVAFSKEQDWEIELIIIDDGSEDHTSRLAEDSSVPASVLKKVIRYTPHRGKGFAVRKGIAESTGELVMFMDSGQNVPLSYINVGIKQIEQGDCDILIGSRYLPASIIKKKLVWYRQISSFLFRKFIKWFLHIPKFISDTQCGFKLFRGDVARELFFNCQSDGFIFDLEIILSAIRKEYRICEFAIEWTCDRDSRLSLIQSLYPILRDIRRLRKEFL